MFGDRVVSDGVVTTHSWADVGRRYIDSVMMIGIMIGIVIYDYR